MNKQLDPGELIALEGQYSLMFIENQRVLKIAEDDDFIYLATASGWDEVIVNILTNYHKKPIQTELISDEDFTTILTRLRAQQGKVVHQASLPSKAQSVSVPRRDTPIVELVDAILKEGLRRKASDIHIESFGSRVQIRYRIDGDLIHSYPVAPEQFPAIATRIKVMAGLNIMESRLPQDGRLSVTHEGISSDMRISVIPSAGGSSIVMRLLKQETAVPELEELGYSDEVLARIRSICANPHGLFLLTGPTGTGKSTTLAALLRYLKAPDLKMITVEDPVEFLLDGINQIQANDKIGLTFESILRRVLRQDPDVLMVGEIRDLSTAQLALRAALTGHFVLSSLHTSDALSIVSRLKSMGVEPWLIAGGLSAVVAQRLVKRLCPDCSYRRSPSAVELVYLDSIGSDLETVPDARGCPSCGSTGFKGRLPLAEVWVPSDRDENFIAGNLPIPNRKGNSTVDSHYFFEDDIMSRLKDGLTTIAEIQQGLGL